MNNDNEKTIRVDDLITLTKLEGELMVIAAFDKLGLSNEKIEDWYEASIGAKTVSAMINDGRITTEASYQLVSSIENLTKDIWNGVWEKFLPSNIPSLEELQEKAGILRDNEAQVIANQHKAFRVKVDGIMKYRDTDSLYGTYEASVVITHCYVDTVNEAITAVNSAFDTDNWNIRDEKKNYIDEYGQDCEPLDFIPLSVTICDVENIVHLKANLADCSFLDLKPVATVDVNLKEE
ncbi:hypothetical protein, partial [Yersinia aldovae]|uniref:hypothetical protein n=1 Tax=Yersinia aldovae TaxID=29483 RepID=UPI00119E1730